MAYGTPKLVAVVGPTATGKSALGIRIARQVDGEIVSADSRQVYRHMDIGTAKPSADQLSAVPHHLIDVVDPDEEYSLALFLRDARRAIGDILRRSRVPVVVGGAGQYMWGLLEGWQVPEVPPAGPLRRELEARAEADGAESLHRELAAVDPTAAGRIDPRNVRRVVRALEVFHLGQGGGPDGPGREAPPFEAIIVGLTLDRNELDRRTDERVDSMIESGWLAEVRALLDLGYDLDLPSMSGLGYEELGRRLRGELSQDEAVDAIKRRTRRFARQQHGWFRLSDARIRWFQATEAGLDDAAEYVSAAL